ncbi:hypothetical protein M431DRAFT_508253 [Trichoderma harzianum CBS 226.95]|uniref:Uncharacterized protein n=1 Tax=Trichoderma harzianum CBS 226.95 TaxID=983964 RepID=A0A2T4ACV5_TRIHA|nr:hypothetical protein M431DRAFT_508253 [Trichoderma harzianum CBS 226.95]PTB54843.1 hypothetical protein M431DRAFT_508253 [Trichoderma harzianum CBS 226.95]
MAALRASPPLPLLELASAKQPDKPQKPAPDALTAWLSGPQAQSMSAAKKNPVPESGVIRYRRTQAADGRQPPARGPVGENENRGSLAAEMPAGLLHWIGAGCKYLYLRL